MDKRLLHLALAVGSGMALAASLRRVAEDFGAGRPQKAEIGSPARDMPASKTAPQREAFRTEDIPTTLPLIREMDHHRSGVWHWYSIRLNERNLGWDQILERAEYVRGADIAWLGSLSVTDINKQKQELIEQYRGFNGPLPEFAPLYPVREALTLSGNSRYFGLPIQITWYRHTSAMRLTTGDPDPNRIRAYVENMVQRSFPAAVSAVPRSRPAEKTVPKDLKTLKTLLERSSFLRYSLEGGLPNEAYCIEKLPEGWHVYYSERGGKNTLGKFRTEAEAVACFLEHVEPYLDLCFR